MKVTSLLITLALFVSCVKVEKKKVDIPTIKKVESYTVKKNGYKCELSGEIEHKEIFLKIEKKEGKISVSLNDFIDSSRISIVSATFENYKMISFSLDSNDNGSMTGTGILSHVNLSSLSDEGKVISLTGKLTLDAGMTSGKLEQKMLISREDKSLFETEYISLAQIENCEEFVATWL